jgi:hypothetical protein
VEEIKESPTSEAKKAVTKKVAQIANATIKIVPEDKADNPLPTIKDFDNKQISTITTARWLRTETSSLRLPLRDKNGAVIEPKKEETVAEMGPLVKAEVIPISGRS